LDLHKHDVYSALLNRLRKELRQLDEGLEESQNQKRVAEEPVDLPQHQDSSKDKEDDNKSQKQADID